MRKRVATIPLHKRCFTVVFPSKLPLKFCRCKLSSIWINTKYRCLFFITAQLFFDLCNFIKVLLRVVQCISIHLVAFLEAFANGNSGRNIGFLIIYGDALTVLMAYVSSLTNVHFCSYLEYHACGVYPGKARELCPWDQVLILVKPALFTIYNKILTPNNIANPDCKFTLTYYS